LKVGNKIVGDARKENEGFSYKLMVNERSRTNGGKTPPSGRGLKRGKRRLLFSTGMGEIIAEPERRRLHQESGDEDPKCT